MVSAVYKEGPEILMGETLKFVVVQLSANTFIPF